MATTFIDVGLITGAQFIFSFVLVWIIVYALLGFTDLFKTQSHLRGLIAILAALLTLASPKVITVISLIVPWFSITFVFIAMVLLGIMIFGVKAEKITGWIEEKDNSVINFVIVIAIIIFAAGLGYVFFTPDSGSTGSTVTTTSGSNSLQTTITLTNGTTTTGAVGSTGAGALMATLFHPKVLGAIFVLLLGLFTVLLLVK